MFARSKAKLDRAVFILDHVSSLKSRCSKRFVRRFGIRFAARTDTSLHHQLETIRLFFELRILGVFGYLLKNLNALGPQLRYTSKLSGGGAGIVRVAVTHLRP